MFLKFRDPGFSTEPPVIPCMTLLNIKMKYFVGRATGETAVPANTKQSLFLIWVEQETPADDGNRGQKE